MKIMFLGDVMGRAGRTAIIERLAKLREDWKLDFVVVNGENASNGAGLTSTHAKALLDAGADVLTLGDHAFDQKDMMQFCETEPRIIRPLNYSKAAPGKGARVFAHTVGRAVRRQTNEPDSGGAFRTAHASSALGGRTQSRRDAHASSARARARHDIGDKRVRASKLISREDASTPKLRARRVGGERLGRRRRRQ